MIKYIHLPLDGYGFDLNADRVVRFNKHPDGTYLNTRATYSINGKQYTHFNLREVALKTLEEKPVVKKKKQIHIGWLLLAGAISLAVMVTDFSIEFKKTVTVETVE